MTKTALITGAGTGIGRATTEELIAHDVQVIGVGRRKEPLAELKDLFPQHFDYVLADISSSSGMEAVIDKIDERDQIDYLVQNAATIEPLGPILKVEPAEWRRMLAVNVEAPLVLTQKSLPYFTADAKILHVSSGAAHTAFEGFPAYCMSKSAFYMLYQALRDELRTQDVWVGSARPGIVDTSMTESFDVLQPNSGTREFMKNLRESGDMVPVKTAGVFFSWLLLEVESEEFIDQEWVIYDTKHHHRWLGDNPLPIPDF